MMAQETISAAPVPWLQVSRAAAKTPRKGTPIVRTAMTSEPALSVCAFCLWARIAMVLVVEAAVSSDQARLKSNGGDGCAIGSRTFEPGRVLYQTGPSFCTEEEAGYWGVTNGSASALLGFLG